MPFVWDGKADVQWGGSTEMLNNMSDLTYLIGKHKSYTRQRDWACDRTNGMNSIFIKLFPEQKVPLSLAVTLNAKNKWISELL